MRVKLKLGLGIASLVLGIALLGGTFAIFTSEVKFENDPITTGTVKLIDDISGEILFNVSNIAPGDTITRQFKLVTDGTIDIGRVLFNFDYEPIGFSTTDSDNQLDDDIIVSKFEVNGESLNNFVGRTIEGLKGISGLEILGPLNADGVEVPIKIELTYNNTHINQNHQQGDSLSMTLSFVAEQRITSKSH